MKPLHRLSFFIAAWGLPLAAQAYLVSGQILEKGSRVPIPGAALELEARNGASTVGPPAANTATATVTPIPTVSYSVTADPQGRYQVTVPPGSYRLVLAAEGYRNRTLDPFEVTRDSEKDLYLEKDGFALPEVVVTTGKEEPVSRETLSKEELSSVPGTAGDVVRALQALPGVYSAGDFSDALLIRGAGPLDNLLLLDGVPLAFPFHFGGLLSTLNSDLIKDVDFSTGGFGPRYGNDYGGMIAITQRDPREDRWGGRLEVTPIFSEAGLEGPLNPNSSLSFSGRRSYLEVLSGFLTQFSPIPSFYDYQGKWSWNPSPDFHLNAVAFGSRDNLGLQLQSGFSVAPAISSIDQIFYHNGFDSQGSSFAWTPDGKNTLTGTLYHSTFSLGVQLPPSTYNFDLQSEDTGTRLDWRHDFGQGLGLEAGVEYTHDYSQSALDGTLLLPQDDLDPFNFSYQAAIANGSFGAPSDNFSLYADQKFESPDRCLVFTLGGRWDFDAYNRKEETSPRISLACHLSENTVLKASWGVYTQLPFQGLYSATGFGNPQLTSETALARVLGVEQKLDDSLRLRVEAYDKDLSNLIEFNHPGGPSNYYDNQGSGYSRGVEVFLRYLPTARFFGWVSYGLSDSQRRDAPTSLLHPYIYDQPQVLTALASYKLTPGWEAGFKVHYAAGLPYTPVKGISGGLPILGPEYSLRYPDYFRLDFSTSLTTVYDTWQWKAFLEIWNATATNNVLTYAYNSDYSQKQPIGEFPFLPYLGFEADF